MNIVEVTISELYTAKLADTEHEAIKDDFNNFSMQLSKGFKRNCLDLGGLQIAFNVLVRLPKLLRYFPSIRYINLYGNLIRDEGLVRVFQIVQNLNSVFLLDIGSNDLTDSCIGSISNIIAKTTVQSLQVGRKDHFFAPNRITRDGICHIIEAICNANSLKCFGISGLAGIKQKKTQLYKEFPQYVSRLFSSCPNLVTLNISDSGLRGNDQKIVSAGIRSNKSLRNLNLSGNDFNPGSEILSSISCIKTLRSLYLSNCNLHESSCNVLSSMFENHSSLIILDISNNPIGSRGVNMLFRSLSHNDHLVYLNASQTGCEERIGKSLAILLNDNQVLSELDLSKNNIGDSVAYVLGSVLSKQNTLETLNLSSCRITDLGALSVAKSIESNKSIHCLSLRDNFLTKAIGYELIEIIQPNETLINLDLSSNQIDCFALDGISAICSRNKKCKQEQSLEELRKQYYHLSIQKSKIPSIKGKLDTIMEVHNSLDDELSSINNAISTIDRETTSQINDQQRIIKELTKMIETETNSIHDIEESITSTKNIRLTIIDQLQQKIQKEQADTDFFLKELESFEQDMSSFSVSSGVMEEDLIGEIKIVEGLTQTIRQAMNSENFLSFKIPGYPFPDEINKDNPHQIGNISSMPSLRKLGILKDLTNPNLLANIPETSPKKSPKSNRSKKSRNAKK